MQKKHLYAMCESAVLIALATVLGLDIFEIDFAWLQGGSISLNMVPLLIIAYRWGALYGIGSGLIIGLLKCLIGGGIGYGLWSVLLDYVLAYGMVGVAGIFCRKSWAIELSVLVGGFARFLIHFISGITIYAITGPEQIYGFTISNAALFSVVYNGGYMLINTALAVVVLSLLRKPLKLLNEKF